MSNILVGITGGIAAYKSCELIRLLKTAGHNVQVVSTGGATQFIGNITFSTLSARPVYNDDMSTRDTPMLHIELAKWAEIIIIAPTTAETISKLAQGNASSLLTALCLASSAPCYIAPAMNTVMWHHPAVQENINKLMTYGYHVLPTDAGLQACGDNGPGRMLEPDVIYDLIFNKHTPRSNINVLITAGPTYEKIDPIRFIGNLSSGKMGYALAQAFKSMGADVHIISGPSQQPQPIGCKITHVVSAQDMLGAVTESIAAADIFICASAIANYSIPPSDIKLKSGEPTLTLTLNRTPDILQAAVKMNTQTFCVGFCAESKDIVNLAQAKLRRKGCHAMVANQITQSGEPFGSDDNQVFYINNHSTTPYEKTNKRILANHLAQRISDDFQTVKQAEN